MTWNYRIILHPAANGTDYAWYALHEVFYDRDGNPDGWTSDPIRFVCDKDEGPVGIQRSLAMAMNDAMRLPVLTIYADDKLVPIVWVEE